MSDSMVWGAVLTDEEAEALHYIEATDVGGDCDHEDGAAFLYVFGQPAESLGLVFPPGKYVRTVHGNEVRAWQVTGDAEAHVAAVEEKWQAYDNAPSEPCGECGAGAHEECLLPGCQGAWH